jgi:hypothetical protein
MTIVIIKVTWCTDLNFFLWDLFQLTVWSQAIRMYNFPLIVIGLVYFFQFLFHAKLSAFSWTNFVSDWASSLKLFILKYRFRVTSFINYGTWLVCEFAMRNYFTCWMPKTILKIWFSENHFFALQSNTAIFFAKLLLDDRRRVWID